MPLTQTIHWTPCSERLPETCNLYMIAMAYEVVAWARWDGEWIDDETMDALTGEVTHWAPLPAHPGVSAKPYITDETECPKTRLHLWQPDPKSGEHRFCCESCGAAGDMPVEDGPNDEPKNPKL